MDDKRKSLGQVFTPEWVVELILDEIGYTVSNPHILHHKILEPSYGEGVFLYSILKRLIEAARNTGHTPQQIADLIHENVWGIEYDNQLAETTKQTLTNWLRNQNIPITSLHLLPQDALSFTGVGMFDYVVGNPPYIRVHNMDEKLRANVKKFKHSVGTTDLYIIFFEAGLTWLKRGGKLGFVTPNSFMRNSSQRSFRQQLLQEKLLTKIVDFGSTKVFDDASTYSCVTILHKDNPNDAVTYVHHHFDNFYTVTKKFTNFPTDGSSFVFANTEDERFLTNNRAHSLRLERVCTVQYGVTTLRNKIFVNPPANLEAEVTRSVVKASTYKGEPVHQKIVFPYKEIGVDRLAPLSEQELQKYPNTYQYLLDNKPELLLRDTEKGAAWFQYGRSQGLTIVRKAKLVLPHVIKNTQTTIPTYLLPADTVVYAGLCVTAPTMEALLAIKTVLETPDFCRFAKLHGKNMGGGFQTFTAKTVKSYGIPPLGNG